MSNIGSISYDDKNGNDVITASGSTPLTIAGGTGSDTLTVNSGANATFNWGVNSGTLTAANAGTLTVNSGTGNPNLTIGGAGTSTVNLGVGTTTAVLNGAGGVALNPGTGSTNLTVNGGTATIAANTTAGIRKVSFSNLSIGAGATVVGAGSSAHANRSVLAVAAGGLSVNATGALDLNDNDLILNFTAGQGVAAFNLVNGYAKTGLQNGGNFDWLGKGIRSTKASVDPVGATALGVVSNLDVGYGLFDGINVADGNEILVKYTYYGDTDVNGLVDVNDVSDFAFGSGTNWVSGDFDYTGTVTGDDVSEFGTGYGAYQSRGAL